MLCKRIELDKLENFNSPEYIAEQKYDGVRLFLYYTAEGNIEKILTRKGIDIWPRLILSKRLCATLPEVSLQEPIMIDGEMIAFDAESLMPLGSEIIAGILNQKHPVVPKAIKPLFICFDCVDGDDCASLIDRKNKLMTINCEMSRVYYRIDSQNSGTKLPKWIDAVCNDWRDAYDLSLAAGHEGLVIKDMTAMYEHLKRKWWKLKEIRSYKGYIVGSKLTEQWTAHGLIGSLVIWLPEECRQIHVANMTDVQRTAMTDLDDAGLPILCPDFHGAEVLIEGQRDTKDSVRHARIKEVYRRDKNEVQQRLVGNFEEVGEDDF